MSKQDMTAFLVLFAVLCTASAYCGALLGIVAVIIVPIVYIVLIIVWCQLD